MVSHNEAWEKLLNSSRRKKDGAQTENQSLEETRTEIERDYDRILFSTPVRRLADKTQVFPLDKNDSVRTRLTHSHEVSNLARSIGTALVFKNKIADEIESAKRDIPALLAAVGLAHDLGNPPFGHQGESAIQSWFTEHQETVLSPLKDEQQWLNDFLKFEGNAQAFRLVTRLQLLNDNFGLDLTYATLAGLMKYPTASDKLNENLPILKKHGFFASEQKIAELVLEKTGLSLGKRHALAYIMEACDDIAYVVLDVEDAVKKGLASFSDLMSYLRHHGKSDSLVINVVDSSEKKHVEYRENSHLSPAELNDISMQRFRVFAIGELVKEARETFLKNENEFVLGNSYDGLLKEVKESCLESYLKNLLLKMHILIRKF